MQWLRKLFSQVSSHIRSWFSVDVARSDPTEPPAKKPVVDKLRSRP